MVTKRFVCIAADYRRSPRQIYQHYPRRIRPQQWGKVAGVKGSRPIEELQCRRQEKSCRIWNGETGEQSENTNVTNIEFSLHKHGANLLKTKGA
jgi:hypothetical protein